MERERMEHDHGQREPQQAPLQEIMRQLDELRREIGRIHEEMNRLRQR